MEKIKKSDHFYLIDGSGYIFRAYYALPPLTRKSDGLPVGAVSGFCNMLFKLLEDSKSDDNLEKPTHFAVIFDSARKNFRNEIYSEYKGNRSDAPDDLIPQFEYIRKSVKAFNLPSIELINYEADDLIATYVEKILDLGAKVTIVSSDKDLMQLYKKGVRIYDPMKNKFINQDDVHNKFGVTPEKVIDVQSLAGDSTDNVPGVPGIGVKTAAELINQYGTLENLLKNASKIKQNKRRETLINNKDDAIISKKLVTLKKDVPVKNKIEEFILKSVDQDKLYTFLREMEFNRLLSSVISTYGEIDFKKDLKEKKKESLTKISDENYFLVDNEMVLMVRGTDTIIDSSLIDMQAFTPDNFPFLIKQIPSDINALGLVKFMFPNKFSIYMHDTPMKDLFFKDERTFSHGCIRLQEPFQFAYSLLRDQEVNPESKFQEVLEKAEETYINLSRKIPVYITYRTAFFDEFGQIHYRADIYGRDALVYMALVDAGVSIY